jgi:hypothetical protein
MNSTTMIMNLVYKPGPVIIAASLPGFKRKSSFTLLFCLFISFAVWHYPMSPGIIEAGTGWPALTLMNRNYDRTLIVEHK